jgi:hypothetical protein
MPSQVFITTPKVNQGLLAGILSLLTPKKMNQRYSSDQASRQCIMSDDTCVWKQNRKKADSAEHCQHLFEVHNIGKCNDHKNHTSIAHHNGIRYNKITSIHYKRTKDGRMLVAELSCGCEVEPNGAAFHDTVEWCDRCTGWDIEAKWKVGDLRCGDILTGEKVSKRRRGIFKAFG